MLQVLRGDYRSSYVSCYCYLLSLADQYNYSKSMNPYTRREDKTKLSFEKRQYLLIALQSSVWNKVVWESLNFEQEKKIPPQISFSTERILLKPGKRSADFSTPSWLKQILASWNHTSIGQKQTSRQCLMRMSSLRRRLFNDWSQADVERKIKPNIR